MKISTGRRTLEWLRVVAFTLAISVGHAAPMLGQKKPAPKKAASKQPAPKKAERFWLAYRYDSTRVVVYFDTVKFNGAMDTTGRKLAGPQAESFLSPVALPASYVASFQKQPGAERFAVGDRYDLLLDSGKVATITLTRLVGDEGDEGTGGQSFIGAIASVAKAGRRYFTKDYYAVTRHLTSRPAKPAARPRNPAPAATLGDTTVPLDTRTRIATLFSERLKADSDSLARSAAEMADPAIFVQQFKTADGTARSYATAVWPFTQGQERSAYKLAAWLTTKPTLKMLAVETCLCELDTPQLPRLLNVVDLGRGRTGVIVETKGQYLWEFGLYEYRDGIGLRKMRVLQSMGVGD
jgi:hypothetical protein